MAAHQSPYKPGESEGRTLQGKSLDRSLHQIGHEQNVSTVGGACRMETQLGCRPNLLCASGKGAALAARSPKARQAKCGNGSGLERRRHRRSASPPASRGGHPAGGRAVHRDRQVDADVGQLGDQDEARAGDRQQHQDDAAGHQPGGFGGFAGRPAGGPQRRAARGCRSPRSAATWWPGGSKG